MADIQLPGKGAVRAYQTGATMNPQAAAAPWAALAGVGEAIGQAGNQYVALAQKAQEAQLQTKTGQMRLDMLKFDTEQQNAILTNPDPSTWVSSYEAGLTKKREQWLTKDLSPLEREHLTMQFEEMAARGTNSVARNMAVASFQNRKTGWNNAIEYGEKTLDQGLLESTFTEMRSVLPKEDVDKVAADSATRVAYNRVRSDLLRDPYGVADKIMERGEDGEFANFKELDPGQRANLRSEAQQAYVGKIKEWSDWADDQMAAGKITKPEQIESRFAGLLPPRVVDRLKQTLEQRQSEEWKAKVATPEYQQEVVGKVSGMLSGYRIGAEGYDEKFVEMDQLVKTLPTGSAVRDGLSEALTQARSGQREIVKSNADAAQQALEDAYKSGRFGPTEFKAMKVSDAIQGGFLRDPAKLSALGFSEDQREAILAEKSDEKRRIKFQEFWTKRGDAAKDVDPLVWRTAEAIRSGADTATFLNGEDQAKLDATYRNYGKARTGLADWLRANPNADESKVTEKIKELGGQADVIQRRASFIGPRPGVSIGDAPGVLPERETSMASPPRGTRVTSYGYPDDETPDTNSANGIGAHTTAADAKGSRDAPTRLRAGDIAVSPDVERQLEAAGASPRQEITVRFADGTTHRGRWMDRTRSDLRGRIDLYSPNGPSPLNDAPVVGWSL